MKLLRARAVIIAIGGGGFIPARMLRTELKIPILAIALELYDDNTNTRNTTVKKIQWFDETSGIGRSVRGRRVLIMDEVDDTRTTLKFAVEEVMKTNAPAAIAVAVVHNKLKPKDAELPPGITYIAGEEVPDRWNCYPWDAAAYGRDIYAHEALARQCAGESAGGAAAAGQSTAEAEATRLRGRLAAAESAAEAEAALAANWLAAGCCGSLLVGIGLGLSMNSK